MRYFTYAYASPGTRRELGNVTKKVYWFKYSEVTPVEDVDSDYFRDHFNNYDMGYYPFIEVDINGSPIETPMLERSSMVNPMRFPSDQGVPLAKEWRLTTETMADPVLYYHYIREKR